MLGEKVELPGPQGACKNRMINWVSIGRICHRCEHGGVRSKILFAALFTESGHFWARQIRLLEPPPGTDPAFSSRVTCLSQASQGTLHKNVQDKGTVEELRSDLSNALPESAAPYGEDLPRPPSDREANATERWLAKPEIKFKMNKTRMMHGRRLIWGRRVCSR